MNYAEKRALVKAQALEEAKQNAEQEARLEQRLRKWQRGTVILGSALTVAIIALIPFLAGFPLHAWWFSVGQWILILTMAIFFAFVYTAGTCYVFWSYFRDIKKIHRKFAPPGSKYRTGK